MRVPSLQEGIRGCATGAGAARARVAHGVIRGRNVAPLAEVARGRVFLQRPVLAVRFAPEQLIAAAAAAVLNGRREDLRRQFGLWVVPKGVRVLVRRGAPLFATLFIGCGCCGCCGCVSWRHFYRT